MRIRLLDSTCGTGSRRPQYATTFLNWQERYLGRRYRGPHGKTDNEKLMHTGLGWWVLFELDPAASTISGEARSPLFPGEHVSHDPSQYRNEGAVLKFDPSWCSRFASSPKHFYGLSRLVTLYCGEPADETVHSLWYPAGTPALVRQPDGTVACFAPDGAAIECAGEPRALEIVNRRQR